MEGLGPLHDAKRPNIGSPKALRKSDLERMVQQRLDNVDKAGRVR